MTTTLYFSNTAISQSGTFPSGEQSSEVPTQSHANANTLLDLSSTAGSGSVNRVVTTQANTNPQSIFFGLWVSAPLAAQTLTGTLTFTNGRSEANLNSNFEIGALAYVWRPSTGALVGQLIGDNINAGLSVVPENTVAGTVQKTTGAAQVITDTPIQNGDVVVIELWRTRKTQAAATAYNNRIDWNGLAGGTTESNVQFSQDLAFFVPGAPSTPDPGPGGGWNRASSGWRLGGRREDAENRDQISAQRAEIGKQSRDVVRDVLTLEAARARAEVAQDDEEILMLTLPMAA